MFKIELKRTPLLNVVHSDTKTRMCEIPTVDTKSEAYYLIIPFTGTIQTTPGQRQTDTSVHHQQHLVSFTTLWITNTRQRQNCRVTNPTERNA